MKTQLIVSLLLAAGTTMAQSSQSNRQAPTAADLITRLDADKDGKISKTEFDGPAEHFTQFDTDKDGYLSTDEIPSGPSPQQQKQGGQQQGQMKAGGQQAQQSESSTDFVTRLDKDSDGKVSSSEFDGPAKVFAELDKNKDGYLSSDEAPSGPPKKERR